MKRSRIDPIVLSIFPKLIKNWNFEKRFIDSTERDGEILIRID